MEVVNWGMVGPGGCSKVPGGGCGGRPGATDVVIWGRTTPGAGSPGAREPGGGWLCKKGECGGG